MNPQHGQFLPVEYFQASTQGGMTQVPNNPMNASSDLMAGVQEQMSLYGDTPVRMAKAGVQPSNRPAQVPTGAGRGLTPKVAKAGDDLDRTTQIAMAGTGQRPMGDGRKPMRDQYDHRRTMPGDRRGMNTAFSGGINRRRWGRSAR